jgi:hypothetical protein
MNILCGYGMGTAIAALVRKPSRRWSRIGFWSLGLLSVPFALATNAAMAGMQTLAKQGWPVILKAIVNRDLGPLIQHLEPMSMFFALISILFGFFVVLFVVRAWTQATPDGIDRLEKLIAKERALAAEDRADTHDHIISMAEEAKEELKQLPEEARDMVSHMSNKLGKVEGRLADFARKQHRICKTHEGSMAIHRRALLNSLPGPHPTYVSQNPDLSSLVIAAAKQDLVREHVNAQWKALTTLGSLVHDGLLLIEQHRQAALGLPRANEGLADDRNEPVFPNWLDDDDGLQRRSAAPPPTLTDAAE